MYTSWVDISGGLALDNESVITGCHRCLTELRCHWEKWSTADGVEWTVVELERLSVPNCGDSWRYSPIGQTPRPTNTNCRWFILGQENRDFMQHAICLSKLWHHFPYPNNWPQRATFLRPFQRHLLSFSPGATRGKNKTNPTAGPLIYVVSLDKLFFGGFWL